MEQVSPTIVVAVASLESEPVLQFAVQDAVAAQHDLVVVHVLRMPPSGPESFVVAHAAAREIAEHILSAAGSRAEALAAGRVGVTSLLLDGAGGVVSQILAAAADAELVMLQHRHLGRLRRLATGSITNAAAGRSPVPLVSVPDSWSPPDPPHGVVSVGVDDPARADGVLRAAAEEAARRGARLRVVHSWWHSSGWDDLVDPDVRSEWTQRALTELRPHLAAVEATFPEVEVDISVQHAPADEALRTAAAESDLLVVGRRDPALPFGSHIGSVARAVLRESACPVMVVEPFHLSHTSEVAPTRATG